VEERGEERGLLRRPWLPHRVVRDWRSPWLARKKNKVAGRGENFPLKKLC